MRRRSGALALTLESVLLAGCATSALDLAPARPDQPWSPAVTPTGEIIPGAKPLPKPVGEATYELPTNSKLANVPAPPPDLDPDRPYTLPELIDIAQSTNPLTRTAWNHAREAALAAGIARSAYLPNLSASAAFVYQRLDQDTLDGTISTLAMQWLLFDFGQRRALNNVAKQASVISNVAFTAAHQQLIYEVSVAFYAHGAARSRVATATQSLQNARDVQAAAEARYANGVGTVVEVAQAQQATAQAQLLEVQAEGAARNAYLSLITAMGISPLTQIRIADTSGRKLPVAATESIAQIVAEALGRRPDVLTAYATQVASAENVRAARAEFLPKVFLVATAAYNQGSLQVTAIPGIGQQAATVNVSQNVRNFTLFAGFTVPLYDGGTRLAALRQAQAKADSAALALAHTQEEAVRQVVAAENALRTSLAANDASSSLVSAAQTTFDAAFGAYRNDVGSITEVTLAQTQLLQAKNASTDAYSAALSAAATLALAAGALGSAPR
jgi:outer membrane protein